MAYEFVTLLGYCLATLPGTLTVHLWRASTSWGVWPYLRKGFPVAGRLQSPARQHQASSAEDGDGMGISVPALRTCHYQLGVYIRPEYHTRWGMLRWIFLQLVFSDDSLYAGVFHPFHQCNVFQPEHLPEHTEAYQNTPGYFPRSAQPVLHWWDGDEPRSKACFEML